MNLSALKKEARELIVGWRLKNSEDAEDLANAIVDKVVEAVERTVYQHRGVESRNDYEAITEAFTNFKK